MMSEEVTPDKGSVQLYRVIITPFILSLYANGCSRERSTATREGKGVRIDGITTNTASGTTSEALGTTVVKSGTSHGSREETVEEARFRSGHGGRYGHRGSFS